MILITGAGGKTGKPVKTLFECMPAFPLSHACIVTDKLQQIPPLRQAQDTALGRGNTSSEHEVPLVYGRVHLEPQAFEARFL